MGSVKNLLTIANKEVGVKESPPNSNRVKYNTWFYGKDVSGPSYPWCMAFCQWVYHKAGVLLPNVKTASCSVMMSSAISKKIFVTKDYRPGDLVLLSFNGSSAPQHCGIIEKVSDTIVTTIEGNTGTGNDANGGAVMKRTRKLSQIVGAVRPYFDEEEDEIDMTIDEFINKLTPAQAYKLLQKATAYADAIRTPKWVEDEGYWRKLMDSGIIRSNTPEGILKRDELASILGRMGLVEDAK